MKRQIEERGGAALIRCYYDGSMFGALQSIYPEYEWHPWRLQHAPQNFWNSMDNHRTSLNWIAELLGIREPEEWYTVKNRDLTERGLGSLFTIHGNSILRVLNAVFPEFDWNPDAKVSKGQKELWQLFKKMTDREVLMNYKSFLLPIKFKTELDIYIPSLQLAIEYQGAQHYSQHSKQFFMGDMEKDKWKRAACKQLGISLVEVPYWWKESPAQLISTIAKTRPDLMSFFNNRRKPSPPSSQFKRTSKDVGISN